MKVLVIPDTQVGPGTPTEHLTAAGNYIREKRPDIVVHLGDHWDMGSLSSYETRGSRYFEGRRYKDDIQAGNDALPLITAPIARLKSYAPELHLLLGNHENRISRAVNEDPRLEGTVGLHDLDVGAWKVHPFLKVVKLKGIWFSHYFQSPASSRPLGGTAKRLLDQIGNSYVQGHRQGLDGAIKQLPDGGRQRGLIAGSFYLHDEHYRGPQGTAEWRGLVMLHNVKRGCWDQMEVGIDWLIERYG